MDSSEDEAAGSDRSDGESKPAIRDVRHHVYVESSTIRNGKGSCDTCHGWEVIYIPAETLSDHILFTIQDAHGIEEIKCNTLPEMLRYMLARSHDVTTVLDLNDRHGRRIGDLIVSSYHCKDED